jgi:hypothetical protein
MSYLWHFYSFSRAALDRIIGSGTEDSKTLVLDAVTWDEWHNDMSNVKAIAIGIVDRGVNYAVFSDKDKEILDEIIKMIFYPEGLGEHLEVEPESSGGIHWNTINELIQRAGGEEKAKYLRLLKNGRRLDSSGYAGDYVILSPEEVSALLEEVTQAYNAIQKWSYDENKKIAKECLIDLLTRIWQKGKHLVGIQG